MRPIIDMCTTQIEVTNHCLNRCSNCTRLVGHHRHPYFMQQKDWQRAIDSMIGYPKMTGIMGGEPLLHPQFEDICRYLHARIEPGRCGLWTCLPPGYEHYRAIICETFGHIFLNDHTRSDILHTPVLVRPDEVVKPDSTPLTQWEIDYLQHHCWVQNSWSACINPHGAWFCEIAGALAMLVGDDFGAGWKVEAEWWTRSPLKFTRQMDKFCRMCGAALPMFKRESTDGRDDVSVWWAETLGKLKSPKLLSGRCVVEDPFTCSPDNRQTATYKDPSYRAVIADRYGMFLMNNSMGFQTPHLRSKWAGVKERANGSEKEQGQIDQEDLCAG